MITASDAVAARPMWLAWYLPTFAGGAPAYGGVVKIGNCAQEPAAAIQTVAARTDAGVSTLQSRLQSKLDTCGPAAAAPLPLQPPSAPTATPGQPTPATPVIDVVAPSIARDASAGPTFPSRCGPRRHRAP